MSIIFSLIIFLVVTLVFVAIVTCFVAVVTALLALIVSKDENRAENSINAVLSSIVFGIVFCIGIVVTHFLACGNATDFGFGDVRFVRLYNCSLESVDAEKFCCTDANGVALISDLGEVAMADSLFYAKLPNDSIVSFDLSKGVATSDSIPLVLPKFCDAERFYYKKHEEVTAGVRTVGFTLTVFAGILLGCVSFLSLRKKKDGIVSRLKRTPVIRRLFV
ncbi:MAG: hypothetical protein IKP81_11280 [Paludibacteraceae bacterium]|nr:hypothetical protein [Paludibacteraceae bacterium]MBR6105622.1 hypothetical protein [Paludibacteraceae bacterium]